MRDGPVLKVSVSRRRCFAPENCPQNEVCDVEFGVCIEGCDGDDSCPGRQVCSEQGLCGKALKVALRTSTVYAAAFVQKVNVLRLAMVTHRVLACRHVMQILAGALKPPMGNASALKIALALESA